MNMAETRIFSETGSALRSEVQRRKCVETGVDPSRLKALTGMDVA
jgi:hypothetical protein